MHVCDMTQIVFVRDDSLHMCVSAESSQTEHELWWVCRQTHAHGQWCNARSGSHNTARATSCRPSFCGCVGVYIYTYIYIHIYTDVRMYINVSIYIYTPHANLPDQLCAGRLFVGTWVYIYIYIYTYVRMYINLSIYIHFPRKFARAISCGPFYVGKWVYVYIYTYIYM